MRQLTGHITSTVRKQRDECRHWVSFLSFVQSRTPAQQMVLPMFRMSLPIWKTLWKSLHRLAKRHVQSDSASLSLNINISHHILMSLYQGLGAAQCYHALMQNVQGLEFSNNTTMFILTRSVPRVGQQELSSLSHPASTRSEATGVGEGMC